MNRFLTNTAALLRHTLRTLGLTRHVSAALRMVGVASAGGYEDAVRAVVCKTIKPGDVVWDVGANRGLYTRLMSELVGESGAVVAIEPEDTNVAILRQAVWPHDNVTVLAMAMSNYEGESELRVSSSSSSGRTHRLASNNADTAPLQLVHVISGDGIVRAGLSPLPHFIKMDVEGAEPEALAGCQATLAGEQLRAVLVEIHFGLLADRGQLFAPGQLQRALQDHGFQTRWVDRSHLFACRPRG